MPGYKLTKLRNDRIEQIKKLGINDDLSQISTKKLAKIIENYQVQLYNLISFNYTQLSNHLSLYYHELNLYNIFKSISIYLNIFIDIIVKKSINQAKNFLFNK